MNVLSLLKMTVTDLKLPSMHLYMPLTREYSLGDCYMARLEYYHPTILITVSSSKV